MASIKLKGDTSGEVIISAPSVAGNATLELQATSGTLATTAQASIGLKNLIINGNMQIAQRGTSFTGLTGISYNLDRWETTAYTMTGGQYQVNQSTDAPKGFAYSQKISCTTAHTQDVNNQFYIQQQIEGVNSSQLNYFVASPDTVTLSFWVKANLTGSYACALKLSDNGSSENNTSTKVYNTTYSISSANTWEKKTVTIVLDSAVGDVQVVDNRFAVSVQWWLGAGTSRDGAAANSWINYGNVSTDADNLDLLGSTSNEWYITGVQLEAGTTATPFENLMYSQQLAMCHRYYQRFQGGAAFTSGIVGCYNATTSVRALHNHIVPFRASPTFGYSALSHFDLEPFDAQPTSLSALTTGNLYQADVAAVDPTARVRGYAATITCDNSTGYFDFSAEL